MRIMILMIMTIVLVMNIYTLQLTVNNLQVSNELAQNTTQRVLRISELRTAALTDYAWHFNTGQKLDMLQDDINEIKNELGLADNFTYAGPNQNN